MEMLMSKADLLQQSGGFDSRSCSSKTLKIMFGILPNDSSGMAPRGDSLTSKLYSARAP